MMISQKQVVAALRARKMKSSRLSSMSRPGLSGREAARTGRRADRDQLHFSQRARQLVRVRRLLDDVPRIRREKVTGIKHRMEAGEYEVSAGDVAEKILSRAVVDRALWQSQRDV